MATQPNQGIQTLLEAEKDAAKVVQQARQYRIQKLKDARSEADREVQDYKKSKDQEFNKFETDRTGTTQNSQTAVDKETEGKLADIQAAYEQRKGEVVKKLINRAMLVEPHLHRNLKKE